MDAPYRSEDQLTKLRDENEKLREQYDGLMYRYSTFNKWPILLLVFFGGLMGGTVSFFAGRNTALTKSQGLLVTHQDRRAIASEVSKRVSAEVFASLQGDLRAMIRSELDRQNVPRRAQARPKSQNQPAQDTLVLEQVVQGRIHSKAGFRQEPSDPERDWWRFNARAGDSVIFRMKRLSGNLDPFLQLYAPDGQKISCDYDSGTGNNASLGHVFTADGQYMLQAGSESFTTWFGNYTLSARLYNQ